MINHNSWELVVTGLGCQEKRFSLDDLRNGTFTKVEVDVTIQCSGNRRSHFGKTYKKAEGIPWNQVNPKP
jgi:DMSO/TMAO reductase YedYZ molybdopterin-dependent catalytic subunit